jgi:hypothetical protein
LSSEAIQHAGQYKLARVKATRQGLPPPPLEIDGVSNFLPTSACQRSQCSTPSQAAANRDRQDVYETPNLNCPAQNWFTFSPVDAQTNKIVSYALGPIEALKHVILTPSGEFRLKILA